MALLAAHLGVVDEGQLDGMSFVFFEDVLAELGHKLHYDAVINYAGNGFCEKSWDMIRECNPFHIQEGAGKGTGNAGGLAGFFNAGPIQIMGGK